MADDTVRMRDIAAGLPGLLRDAPVIVHGAPAIAGLIRPSAKISIGRVLEDRAARHGDRVFIRYEDEAVTYREANETVNRYAAVLAARGVGRGDVLAVMLTNSPRMVLILLAAVKLGAIAGILNHHHRGKVLAHSVGLLRAKTLIGEQDLLAALDESGGSVESGARVADAITVDEFQRLALAQACTENPAATSSVRAKDKAFYIFISGDHRRAESQV